MSHRVLMSLLPSAGVTGEHHCFYEHHFYGMRLGASNLQDKGFTNKIISKALVFCILFGVLGNGLMQPRTASDSLCG